MLQSVKECYRVLQSDTECYRVLQSVTEYDRVLESVTQCYRVLESVTECYRVLQSVTEDYRVLQCITKYYKANLAHLLGPIFGLILVSKACAVAHSEHLLFHSGVSPTTVLTKMVCIMIELDEEGRGSQNINST